MNRPRSRASGAVRSPHRRPPANGHATRHASAGAMVHRTCLASVGNRFRQDRPRRTVQHPRRFEGRHPAVGRVAGLARATGFPTVVYDFPSISLLARHLSGTGHATPDPAPGSDAARADIAIVGMGCRFPAPAIPTHSGSCCWRVGTRSARRRSAAPTFRPPDCWNRSISSMRLSSASAPAKPNRWIRNSVCCWRWPGRRSSMRDRTRQSRRRPHRGHRRHQQFGLHPAGAGRSRGRRPYVATGNALSVAANRISYALDLRGRAGRSIPHVRRRSSRCIRRAARCSAASPMRRWPAGQPDSRAAIERLFHASGHAVAGWPMQGVRRGSKRLCARRRRGHGAAQAARRCARERRHRVRRDPRLGGEPGWTQPWPDRANGPAQQAVIHSALRDAGVRAQDIGFVEAHGRARRSATRSN